MLSAPLVRHIGGVQQLQRRRGAAVLRRRNVVDGSGISSSSIAPSAAATEAVYALASVAAASSTLVLSSLSRSNGDREDKWLLVTSRGDDASLKTRPQPPPPQPPPPSSRLLYVSLSIASFLPYINFAAFACLASIESFRKIGKEEEDAKEKKKNSNLFSAALLLSPSALGAFSVFYALPFLLVALTTDTGSGSEHSAFAIESLVLGIVHFQAIWVAGERREQEGERGEREEERAAANEEEGGEEDQILFASLAASELERFDARLGLKTAKAARLKELARAAGVLGSERRRKNEEHGLAPVARTKAGLAAALAAAATLEGGGERCSHSSSESSGLDFETRDWLTSELAKEVEPLVEKKRAKRRTRGGKGGAGARRLEELDDDGKQG